MPTLASIHLGPIQFDQPVWLTLLVPCVLLILWIGRQTLSGMGTTSRRVAMAVRLLVVLLIIGAIARPYWRKESKIVNVVVIRDTSDSVRRPVRSPGGTAGTDLVQQSKEFVQEAAKHAKPDDLISLVTAARRSYVQTLPVPTRDEPDSEFPGETDATNLADSVTLSMAIMPGFSANRLLLISDFNQTAGNLMEAANAAKAAGVPIDVLPLRYKFEQEVMVGNDHLRLGGGIAHEIDPAVVLVIAAVAVEAVVGEAHHARAQIGADHERQLVHVARFGFVQPGAHELHLVVLPVVERNVLLLGKLLLPLQVADIVAAPLDDDGADLTAQHLA